MKRHEFVSRLSDGVATDLLTDNCLEEIAWQLNRIADALERCDRGKV